jgi:TRAP transporter TAXI family solute receptor
MTTARRSSAPWIALVAVAWALATLGCSRGPDETALRAELQSKLDQRFKPGLFGLPSFRRLGSAPLPASETGSRRLVVYFNATLRLNEGYDFGDWHALSPGTLAHVLGATEKGLFGIKPGESRPGQAIKVYGSSTYEWTTDRWRSVDATSSRVASAAAPGNAAPSSQSRALIDRLAALVDVPPPGPKPEDEQVISEELDRALRAITLRRERRTHVYVFASGPEDGEYHPIGESLAVRATKLGEKLKVRNLTTQGSVENVRLIAAGQADYALVQSNVAATAFAGEAPFAQDRAVTSLRALGSLFPEPLHLVVSATSPLRTVPDLRGKRVAVGPRDSGTRADALAVLAAHRVTLNDLAQVSDEPLEAAAAGLQAGRLDAFFATVGAPTRALQRLAVRHQIRLVPLELDAVERLVTQNAGLIRFIVPAKTYPGQNNDVTTIAATAVLVTRSDVSDGEADVVLRLVFENPDYLAAGSTHGTKISRSTGLRGITIPIHPAASRYLGPSAPNAPGPAPRPR